MGEDGSWKQKNHVPETRISYREKNFGAPSTS